MKRNSVGSLVAAITLAIITFLGLRGLWKTTSTKPHSIAENTSTNTQSSLSSNDAFPQVFTLLILMILGLGIIWTSNPTIAASSPPNIRFQETLIATYTNTSTATATRTPTITPTVHSPLQATLVATDGSADDNFGFDAAISGDTIVVGAPLDGRESLVYVGSAYVYVRNGTTWTLQQKLTASDGETGDSFGYSVAIHGDIIVVGASADDDNGAQSGAAYVYVRSGTTWTQQQKLTASDGATLDALGRAVAIYGETIVIGAFGDDTNGAQSGAAYVFVRSGDVWTQQQELLAAGSSNGLGYSVDIYGDTIVSGTPYENAAYVFQRNGTSWTQQQRLTPSIAVSEGFGNSVAIYEDMIIVGSPDTGSGADGLFGYVRNGTIWTQVWNRNSPPRDTAYGWSVDLYREVGLVGQMWATDTGISRVGAGWAVVEYAVRTSDFHPDNPALDDQFGYSVARDGMTIVITRPNGDPAGVTNAGSVYVYTVNGPPWETATPSPTPTLTLTPSPTNTPLPVSAIISENEFFTAVVAARQVYPDIITIVPDFVSGAINMTIAVSGGVVGNVTVTATQGQGFVTFNITSMTVNGAAAPANYVSIINRDLPAILTTTLDSLLSARFGGGINVQSITINSDAMIINAQP